MPLIAARSLEYQDPDPTSLTVGEPADRAAISPQLVSVAGRLRSAAISATTRAGGNHAAATTAA